MTKRPLIGISGSRIPDTGVFAGTNHDGVNDAYVRAVAAAGGIPVILPVIRPADDSAHTLISGMIAAVDGLILSGGHDVAPSFYGKAALPELGDTWPERDAFDKMLLELAIGAKKAVLGICRGFQLINAALGGDLLQDVSYSETDVSHHVELASSLGRHVVRMKPGTLFRDVLGAHEDTNSYHHQIVTRAGNGLTVSGQTEDGVIEAVEHIGLKLLAVQWHPEMMVPESPSMRRLFAYFVSLAQSRSIS